MAKLNLVVPRKNEKSGKTYWDNVGFLEMKTEDTGFLKLNLLPVGEFDGFIQIRPQKKKEEEDAPF